MTGRRIHVVHLEDVPEDAELVQAMMEDSGVDCEIVRVDTEPAFVAALAGRVDLILADYSLPSFDGLGALEVARALRPDVPFVFVTGALKDDSAIEALRRGAADFIVKQRLTRLVPAVHRALREAEERVATVRAQAENARLYIELKAAVRARDEMLAIVSHDLRNPLSSIVASAALLGLGQSKERVIALAEKVSRAASRMGRLIDDLLDLARIDAGTLEIAARPFDVGETLRECVEQHTELAGQKEIEVHAEAPPGLTGHGDRDRILQVLANLISNALRFTPTGGRITVTGRRNGDQVVIEIADTGPGIPPEQLDHVFDKYWRAHRADRSSMGLGLSIVKGLVEAHGGRVSVTSAPGRGACFAFTLPTSLAAVEATSRVRPLVLVVDDDPDIREALAETLTGLGYRVVCAGDGLEALERLRSHGAELIILDLMMPRMDGIEFRMRQREDPTLAQIPTVVITAFDPLQERIVPLEPQACIRKPLHVGELVSVIRRLVRPQQGDASVDGSKP